MDKKTLLVWIGIVFNINNSQSASISRFCPSAECDNKGGCLIVENGHHVCFCMSGWTGTFCHIDIDECIADHSASACPVGETCTNTPGGFRCDNCSSSRLCKISMSQEIPKIKRLLTRTFPTPPPPMTTTETTTQSPPPFTTKAPPTPPDIKTPSPITIQPTGSLTSTLAPPSIPVG